LTGQVSRELVELDTVRNALEPSVGRATLVGVDGMSAAGKSSFAQRLAESSGAEIVAIDDFYRVMDDDVRFDLEPDDAVRLDYDWQRLATEVLTPLHAGRTAHYRQYDWATGTLPETRTTATAAGIVVVEGVYACRPELFPMYDVTVFVTTPDAVRWERQGERPESLEWKQRWDRAEQYYLATHDPAGRVDFIVAGDVA
jgi:uridine kinase